MIFLTNDTQKPTYIWSNLEPGTHRIYHMKTEDNQVYTETRYKGDAVFGGKNFYVLIAELNATKAMLSKNDPQELGQKIYDGTIKLISRKDAKGCLGQAESSSIVCPREIKWPIILEDDERKWTNVKPVIATTVLPPPLNNDCECDICIEE
jgi:hypothetical protein